MIKRHRNVLLLPVFLMWLAGIAAGPAQPAYGAPGEQAIEEDLLIVATADTYAKSEELTNFLDKKAVTYKHIEPSMFDVYRAAGTIAVIAGMDERSEIVDIVGHGLNQPEEMDWLAEPGNSAIYARDDVWTESQKVMIIAGATSWDAADALTYYRNQWLADLATWLEIKLTREEVYSY